MSRQTKIIKISLAHQTLYVTMYDQDLIIDGHTYLAHFLLDDIKLRQTASFTADRASFTLYDDQNLNFQGGRIQIANYDLEAQIILEPTYFTGHILAIERQDHHVTLVSYGQKEKFSTYIHRDFSQNCQAIWGDQRCGIDTHQYRLEIEITGNIAHKISYHILSGTARIFPKPYLQDPLGNVILIYDHDPLAQSFYVDPFVALSIGKKYTLYAGCGHSKADCHLYQNFSNYLGF